MRDLAKPRTVVALRNRWCVIQHDVSKFIGAFANIESLNISGLSKFK